MVEVQPTEKPRTGWPRGHKYGLPCKCAHSSGKRVRYVQPEKVPSYKPIKVYKPPEFNLPDDTTYKMSYEPFDPKAVKCCRGVPVTVKGNLTNAGDFCGLTTQRMSYGAWPGVTRTQQILPRDHTFGSRGPMQDITTNRHDYVPKPIVSVDKVIQQPNLGLSTARMAGDSTMTLSYKCPDYERFKPSLSYKPDRRYVPPEGAVDGNTVQKMSYVPWEPLQKIETPWRDKREYEPPREKLDGQTIYSGSYIPPGTLLDDEEGHCMGCYCVFPAECYEKDEPPQDVTICPKDYDPNTDPPRPPPIIEEPEK